MTAEAKALPLTEESFLQMLRDNDLELIPGEDLQVYVSERFGRSIEASWFVQNGNQAYAHYRDSRTKKGRIARIDARRVLDDPIADIWIVELSWVKRSRLHEVRFMASGDLFINGELNVTTTTSTRGDTHFFRLGDTEAKVKPAVATPGVS